MSGNWLSRNQLLAAGAAAVLCGLLFLGLAEAPPRLLLINLIALGVGAALVGMARLMPPLSAAVRGAGLLAIAAALLATALFGVTSEGASRWILLGGLSLQPSLILVPVLLLAHVARPDDKSSIAVGLAALAMALQPDRSIAGAIAAVTLVDAVLRRSPAAWLTALTPAATFAASLLRPDKLPAVPHVDLILWTAWDLSSIAGAAVWLGTALMFVPAVTLWRRGEVASAAAFGTLWGSLVLSAALANYPTPLVGYGASCIIGYLLAGLAMPGRRRSGRDSAAPTGMHASVPQGDPPGASRIRPAML